MVFYPIFLLVIFATLQHESFAGILAATPLSTARESHVSPFTVAIIRDKDWYKRCVGTLISDSFILTSAQCSHCEVAELIMGAYDIFRRERTQIRQHITQDDTIVHPDFDPITLENDIALIKLPVSVPLSRFVNVARLPPHNLKVEYGTEAYLIGWEHYLNGYSNTLTEAEVYIVSVDRCESFWSSAHVNQKTICASNLARETQWAYMMLGAECIIDPGSALVLHGHPDMLIGILTKHDKCGSFSPEIYVNIAKYIPWIEEVVAGVELAEIVQDETELIAVPPSDSEIFY